MSDNTEPTDEALLGIYLDAALPLDDDDSPRTWAGLRAVWDAARAADAEEIAGYVALTDRQGDLLRSTVAVLRGAPPALTMWSHHDIPELAAAMKAERDALAQQIAAVRALAFYNWSTRKSGWGLVQEICDALDASPVTPESRARLTAGNLPQRSQHDFDIATGRPLGPAVTPESPKAERLSPKLRADLVDFAAERIQAVWNDVGETDATTLAQNVVAAQEFLWLSLHFPTVTPESEKSE